MTPKQDQITAPIGTATAGSLEIAGGSSRVTLLAHAEVSELYRARFEGVAPMVLAHDGRVTIEYPRLAPSEWLRPTRRAAEIMLNPSLPWTLVVSGGVSELRADLRRLALRSFEVRGGARDAEILLPEAQGVVAVRVTSGASNIALRRPASSPVRAHIASGASRLTFDEQRFGAVGGEMQLASPDAEQAGDRYEIEIGGGASGLVIARHEEGRP